MKSENHEKCHRKLDHAAKQMRAEGQGIYQLQIVTPTTTLPIVIQALAGDPFAIGLLKVISRFFTAVEKTQPSPLCPTCDNELSLATPPDAVVIMTAARDDPSMAIINGLCPECAATTDVTDRVFAKLKSSPHLRPPQTAAVRQPRPSVTAE
jgi:hypothetical protein